MTLINVLEIAGADLEAFVVQREVWAARMGTKSGIPIKKALAASRSFDD
ncbi:hypothetical protein [Mycolicibacterium moriokaense]|uniref:Uncharacterized protein n=1 Tax=Mycolicibacterium moriokaense TaxID=39691 RepID=A0A318HCT8_9MYCO|nr:hypothetical protein [Mycolicibacterium moriokaense]PXX06385.1 hypothetical protein C8E89_114158 [Mycolicibacterium moriokaense]